MSQSQDTIPELIVDDDVTANSTPTKENEPNQAAANNEVGTVIANQGAAAAAPAPTAPQKAKKRTYTKCGGATASKKKLEESDEDEVGVL